MKHKLMHLALQVLLENVQQNKVHYKKHISFRQLLLLVLTLQSDLLKEMDSDVRARFRHKVVPGDVLTLEVELIKCKGPVGIAMAKATNGENLAIISFVDNFILASILLSKTLHFQILTKSD